MWSMPSGFKLALGAQGLALGWSIWKRATVPAVVSGATIAAMLMTWYTENKAGKSTPARSLKAV